jgi:hypothetical protein
VLFSDAIAGLRVRSVGGWHVELVVESLICLFLFWSTRNAFLSKQKQGNEGRNRKLNVNAFVWYFVQCWGRTTRCRSTVEEVLFSSLVLVRMGIACGINGGHRL